MFVKRESSPDLQPVDDNAAGAVGDAPLLVAEALEHGPRGGKVVLVDPDKLREAAFNRFCSEGAGVLVFAARVGL